MLVRKFVNSQGIRFLEENPEALPSVEVIFNSFRLLSYAQAEALSGSSLVRNFIKSITEGWEFGVLIERDFPTERISSANAKIEFQKCIYDVGGKKLWMQLEVLGDNRQAIGTNLLKLNQANKFRQSSAGSIAIGIAFEKSFRDLHWDPGVATFEEYEYALRDSYRSYFDTPLLLLGIGV